MESFVKMLWMFHRLYSQILQGREKRLPFWIPALFFLQGFHIKMNVMIAQGRLMNANRNKVF